LQDIHAAGCSKTEYVSSSYPAMAWQYSMRCYTF